MKRRSGFGVEFSQDSGESCESLKAEMIKMQTMHELKVEQMNEELMAIKQKLADNEETLRKVKDASFDTIGSLKAELAQVPTMQSSSDLDMFALALASQVADACLFQIDDQNNPLHMPDETTPDIPNIMFDYDPQRWSDKYSPTELKMLISKMFYMLIQLHILQKHHRPLNK
jgi:hypothetical protein